MSLLAAGFGPAVTPVTEMRDGTLEEALALGPELYRFVAASARDHHLAEDIVQETLSRVQTHAAGIEDVRAWCFTVALNLLRSHFRRQRWLPLRRAERLEGWDFVQRNAVHDEVHRALGTLTHEQRTSLLLQVIGGFSVAEIAAAERASEAAIKQRLHRAREAFRRAYRGDLP